jgi:hypothetical protein
MKNSIRALTESRIFCCCIVPIPKIRIMTWSMEEFTFGTALDLNMGYYHIKIDDDS